MDLSRGRGPFSTVMAKVEVPSNIKHERDIYIRQGVKLPGKFFDHTL